MVFQLVLALELLTAYLAVKFANKIFLFIVFFILSCAYILLLLLEILFNLSEPFFL
jgi:hypothetical protein